MDEDQIDEAAREFVKEHLYAGVEFITIPEWYADEDEEVSDEDMRRIHDQAQEILESLTVHL